MKSLKEYLIDIDESKLEEEDIDYIKDICDTKELDDCTIMVLSDDNFLDIVEKMVKSDNYSNGHYELEERTDEYEEYDWDEDQQLLIDYTIENDGEIYELMNGIGDFSQPVGLVSIIRK